MEVLSSGLFGSISIMATMVLVYRHHLHHCLRQKDSLTAGDGGRQLSAFFMFVIR